jgi:pyridoxamine 5'-phosphate oxidase
MNGSAIKILPVPGCSIFFIDITNIKVLNLFSLFLRIPRKFQMKDINEHVKNLRSEYSRMELNESDILKSPFLQFEKWMKEAIAAAVFEPHAMTLSTVSNTIQPSARVVLLRDFGVSGFTFYTNYQSKKGQDIAGQPHAAMSFFWPQLERQIHIEGILEKVDAAISDAYFNSRPRESKIGAWVSGQSQPIHGRHVLEQKFNELTIKYAGKEVPRPAYWGGYKLQPSGFEFWQGRPSRLHDRIQYQLTEGNWLIQRLSP